MTEKATELRAKVCSKKMSISFCNADDLTAVIRTITRNVMIVFAYDALSDAVAVEAFNTDFVS